jgi:hypothetical protein
MNILDNQFSKKNFTNLEIKTLTKKFYIIIDLIYYCFNEKMGFINFKHLGH